MLLRTTTLARRCTLDAHHLAERVDDFYVIRLRSHHRVNVLVGGWRLIKHAFVLAALNTCGRLRVILKGEAFARLIAAYGTPCAV